jgi:glycosyltransferase involved in cell wall biosynthesis
MRFLMLNWRDPKNPLAGGAERVTEGYLAALRDRGHEVYWFANAFPGGAPEETIRGIRVIRGGGKGSSVLCARRWYRGQKPFDLVIDQHHGIPWYAPWWCKTHCVSYIHEVLGPIWNAFYRWPWNVIGRWQERWTHRLYRNVPFWVGCESTRDALRRHGVRGITVLHYGIHTVPPPELEPKPLREPVQLIVVSRLAPNKRVSHSLEATRVLLQRGIRAHLTVVGSGEEEGLLRRLAAEEILAGQVTFAGQLSESEKDERLRRSHVLLHTSIREGWGLNVLEANAMGTPGVVYPVAGLVESTLDGRTGLVTPRETPESIADAIQSLLKTPERYETFRRNAQERSKEFHWSRVLPPACDWLEAQAKGQPLLHPELQPGL